MPALPRILSQLGDAQAIHLPEDLRERVEVIPVPAKGPIPEDLRGDILLMLRGNDAAYELAQRGVKWVHFIGTGVDTFDVARLAHGRILTNSRGAAAVPISEWVLSLLLLHEKCLPEIFMHEPPARWPVHTPLGTLYGRQVSLLGLGAIGEAVAQRLLPFGARVRALRASGAPSPLEGVQLVDHFEALIDGADHLVLAAPSTAQTKHILNSASLSRAKPGLHVVNIARGDLIDDVALRTALDSGLVSAASLDATRPEPLPQGHWMYTHPRVRLSPHISWSWPRFMDTLGDIFGGNVRRYLAGQPLANVIDPAKGY